jgi:Tfp pilus assembly protein PilF
MKNLLILTKTILFLVCLVTGHALARDIVIEFAQPDWTFTQAANVSETSAKIDLEERGFVKRIIPLFENKDYQALVEEFESRPLEHDSAALKLMRGQVYINVKKYAKAEQAITAALQDMPDLALAHRTLSMVYMVQKDYAKAQSHLIRSVELGLADAQLFGQLAYVNLHNDQPFGAIAGYQQAIYLDPDNPQWQQGMLYALVQTRAWDQASALLEQQLASDVDNSQLWLIRSQIAFQQQRNEQALTSLEAAIRLGEANLTNLLTAARLHLHHGSVAQAISLVTRGLDLSTIEQSDQLFADLDVVFSWLLDRGDDKQLTTLLKAAEKFDSIPTYQAKLSSFRGQLALNQHDLANAESHLVKAVEQDPLLGEALLALAQVYHQQNQYQRAQLYYVRASALSQVKARALLSHAQLLIDQKSYPQALELLQQMLRNEPSRRDIQHNINELQQLVQQDQYAS